MEWLPKWLDDIDAAWYAVRQSLPGNTARQFVGRMVFALMAAVLILNPAVRWALLAAIAAFGCAELGYRLSVIIRTRRPAAR